MTFAADLARVRPDEIALRDAVESLTWADADARLRPAVNALAGLPSGAERRVAILAGNSAQTLLAYAACTLAGISAVAVNCHLTAGEVAYLLSDSGADAVLADAAGADTARAAADLAGVGPVVAWGGPALPARVLDWADWASDPAEPTTRYAPRPTLVYTSGTTGRPKGVELPPTSFVGGVDIAEHVRRLGENRMIPYGRHLVVGPLYHSGPLTGTRLFVGGASVTVLGRFDAETTLQAIDRDRIGSTIMVPTHFQRLLALPDDTRRRYRFESLRYVLQVGAKCPAPVKRAMIDWWGPVVWESYGASEVGTTCLISAAEWLARPGSVGRAVPPFEAFIAGPGGEPAAPGVEGPLWFRDVTGRGVVYANGADGSPGTFTLGEIGRMDDEGYVWITDRFADLVVSGGVNIYPAETEAALLEHPDVADAACIGVPDDEYGERLLALVVSSSDVTPPSTDDLDRHCRARLAGYKCPKEYVYVDALERTPIGKLDKRALRQRYGSVAHA
jgi:long-chain acyl-CoA synthetase